MKKIITSFISSTAKQPLTKASLDLLNSNTLDFQKIIGSSQTGLSDSLNSSKGFILYGLKNSGTLSSPNISAGAIYYNDTIYLVNSFVASSITNSIGLNLVSEYDSNDPILFSDNTSHNVHLNAKGVISDTSSYDILYSNLLRLNSEWVYTTFSSGMIITSGSPSTTTLGSANTNLLAYKVDYASRTMDINFNIVGFDATADQFGVFGLVLDNIMNADGVSKTFVSNFTSTGYFNNAYNTSSPASGTLKRGGMIIDATGTGLTMYLLTFYDFDANGSNNLSLKGSIRVPFTI